MSNGDTATQDRRSRLLAEAFDSVEPVEGSDQTDRRQRLLGEVFTPVVPEAEESLSNLQFIARMAQGVELSSPRPDRPIIEELGVGAIRGYAGLIESGGGLSLLAAGQIKNVVGDNPLSRFLTTFGEFESAMGAITRARFPRSSEPGFTARRTVGDVGESLPNLALQFGGGIAVKPLGVLAQVGTFAGTGAAPVVGQQYVAALAATGDPNKAAAEAFGAGLIVLGLNSIPGFAAFRKFKGSQRFFMDAAVRIGRRTLLVGPAESLEEMAEAVLIDTYASILRDDPAMANRIFEGDPEYWSDVLRQGIAGFFAGSMVGVTLGSMEVVQREQLIRQVEEIIKSSGPLSPQQMTTTQEFITRATEAQRQRELGQRVRRRIAGEEEPPVPVREPRVGELFVGQGRQVRVVSMTDQRLTYKTEAGDTVTVDRTDFASQFEAVDTRRRPSPEQMTRQAVKSAQQATAKGETASTQDVERTTLDELSDLRTRVESGEMSIDQARNELQRIARKQIKGPDVPKPVLTAIGQATTKAGIRKVALQVRRAVANQRRAKAIASAKKAVTKAAKSKGFRGDIIKGLRRVARGFKAARMSKQSQRALDKLIATLERSAPDTLEAALGEELDRLRSLDTKNAPTEEIRQIASAIDTQARVATIRRQLSRKGRAQRIRKLSNEIADEMATHLNPKATRRGRILDNSQGAISSLFRITFGFIEQMDLDTLGEALGGEDSTTWRALFRAIELGQRDALSGYYQSTDRLGAFLKKAGVEYGSEELSRLSNELSGTSNAMGAVLSAMGLETNARGRIDAETRTVTLESGEKIPLFVAEIMGLAAVTADEETRNMIVKRGTPVRFNREPTGKSRTLTEEDLNTILAEIKPIEQSIVDFMIQEINGPVKETMRTWSIQELGYDITKPETWWTRHRRLEGKRDEKEPTITNLRGQFLQSIGMRPGVTKARGQDVKSAIEVQDIFIDYNNVTWQTNMVAHLVPAVLDAKQILGTKAVSNVLDNSKASRARKAYDTIFNQIAREVTGQPSTRGFVESLFDPLIRNLPKGILGLNPRVAAYQIVSAAMAQQEIPARFLLSAASSALDFTTIDRIKKNPLMRLRMETSVMGLINESSDLSKSLMGFGTRGEGPMFMIRFMDRVAINVVWRAAELQAESEGLEGDALQERTFDIAERAISRTQPMFDTVHIHARTVEVRARGGLWRLSNFFRAQRNKLVTMVIRSSYRMRRTPTQAVIVRETANIGVTVILNSIAIASLRNILTVGTIASLFAGTLTDEEEMDELGWTVFIDSIRTMFGIPFLGDWIGGFVFKVMRERTFKPEFTPLEGMIADAQIGLGKFAKGAAERDLRKMLEGAAEIAGVAAAMKGIPLLPILREVENVVEEMEDGNSGVQGAPP